ncbi:MAG: hypothetical protein IJA94_05650 [Bacilli bacterium]|nr:hypothetical protein [Bacilli bacterium]
MEKNKYTFYSIVILLIILVPCSIYGTYMHIKTNANINHEFKFNNKLYFYENDKLLGTYDCKSDDCDYAIHSSTKSSIINSQYTFISDDKKVYLYDITSKESLKTYEEVQTIMENIYKVRQNGLWGAISISATLNTLLECSYDDLEFKNNKFLALKDNKWSIYQNQKELFSTELEIKDFTEELVVVTNNGIDKLYDYQSKEYLENVLDKELTFVSEFILLERNSNYYVYQFYQMENVFNFNMIGNFFYNGEQLVTHKKTETMLEFYAGEELLKSIDISTLEND